MSPTETAGNDSGLILTSDKVHGQDSVSTALANWTLLEVSRKFPCKGSLLWHCGASRNIIFDSVMRRSCCLFMYSLALYCDLFYSSHM